MLLQRQSDFLFSNYHIETRIFLRLTTVEVAIGVESGQILPIRYRHLTHNDHYCFYDRATRELV